MCYKDNSIACLANTHFVWFDLKSGNKTEPPERVEQFFDCGFCNNLKSLEGSPREVGGDFNCSDCYDLLSLDGKPEHIGGRFIH